MKLPSKKSVAIVALSLIVAASLAANGWQYRQLKSILSDSEYQSLKDNRALIAKVSRFMILPTESPTIATVTDPVKLQDQPFFKDAKAGDRVLIYPTSKKAILYSPSADKIVEVAPFNEKSAEADQPAAPDDASAVIQPVKPSKRSH